MFLLDTEPVTASSEKISKLVNKFSKASEMASDWDTSNDHNFDFASAQKSIANNLQECSKKVANTAEAITTVVQAHDFLQNTFIFDESATHAEAVKSSEKVSDLSFDLAKSTSDDDNLFNHTSLPKNNPFADTKPPVINNPNPVNHFAKKPAASIKRKRAFVNTSHINKSMSRLNSNLTSVGANTNISYHSDVVNGNNTVKSNSNTIDYVDGYTMLDGKFLINCDSSLGNVGDVLNFTSNNNNIECIVGSNSNGGKVSCMMKQDSNFVDQEIDKMLNDVSTVVKKVGSHKISVDDISKEGIVNA